MDRKIIIKQKKTIHLFLEMKLLRIVKVFLTVKTSQCLLWVVWFVVGAKPQPSYILVQARAELTTGGGVGQVTQNVRNRFANGLRIRGRQDGEWMQCL